MQLSERGSEKIQFHFCVLQHCNLHDLHIYRKYWLNNIALSFEITGVQTPQVQVMDEITGKRRRLTSKALLVVAVLQQWDRAQEEFARIPHPSGAEREELAGRSDPQCHIFIDVTGVLISCYCQLLAFNSSYCYSFMLDDVYLSLFTPQPRLGFGTSSSFSSFEGISSSDISMSLGHSHDPTKKLSLQYYVDILRVPRIPASVLNDRRLNNKNNLDGNVCKSRGLNFSSGCWTIKTLGVLIDIGLIGCNDPTLTVRTDLTGLLAFKNTGFENYLPFGLLSWMMLTITFLFPEIWIIVCSTGRCRKTHGVFDKCMKDNLDIDRPEYGYFTTAKVYECNYYLLCLAGLLEGFLYIVRVILNTYITERPTPPKHEKKVYENATPGLSENYPKPAKSHVSTYGDNVTIPKISLHHKHFAVEED
uniref:Uncharacterized protein n=1 Tax=Glossina pallidipes TaxID=7398 RepID=A0A1B0A3N4_GLOPL